MSQEIKYFAKSIRIWYIFHCKCLNCECGDCEDSAPFSKRPSYRPDFTQKYDMTDLSDEEFIKYFAKKEN